MAGYIMMTLAVGLTLVPRCVAWIAVQAKFYRADGWGVAADVVVGLWVGLLLLGLHRYKPWAAAVAAAAWVGLGFLAAEHVRALGAWPDARQAAMLADVTFVSGSLLRPAYPVWMVLTALLGAAAVWRVRGVRYGEAARRGLLVAAAGTLALVLLPPNAADGWRGTHFVTENLGRVWQARTNGDGLAAARDIAVGASHRQQVEAWFRTDLDGTRITAPPEAPPAKLPNVLLVVVESLGSDRIGPVHGGPHDPGEAPHLAALARRSLFVPRFVNQQRQTNRGTYTLLSGALPLLQKSTPRMSIFASLPDRPYLPAALAGHGYRTAYLQSADLAFMGKAPFLEAAGFEEVLSAVDVRPARASSAWGVDDVTLMEQTLKWIDAAEAAEPQTAERPAAQKTNFPGEVPGAGSRPWFLTVVTAGTHHPYMIPEDFAALPGETEDQRAFRYADAAIGRLVSGLDTRETWRDTLVIVTSDETGVTADRGRIPHPISEAWGVFLATPPTGENGPVEGLFAQSDVPLSVLDYLGLARVSPAFPGRSVFRKYHTPRDLPFANVYRRQIGVFAADGSAELFGEHFNPIARFVPATPAGDRPRRFGDLRPEPEAADHDFRTRPLLAALALWQSGDDHAPGPRPLAFIPPGRYTVTPSPEPRRGGVLTRGQFFYGPPDSRVTIEVSLRAEPATAVEGVEVSFLEFKVPAERGADGRYQLRRTVSLQRVRSSFEVQVRLFTEHQQPVEVQVERAEITIRPIE